MQYLQRYQQLGCIHLPMVSCWPLCLKSPERPSNTCASTNKPGRVAADYSGIAPTGKRFLEATGCATEDRLFGAQTGCVREPESALLSTKEVRSWKIRLTGPQKLAPRHGFEPRFTAPKAAVLPLDDRGSLGGNLQHQCSIRTPKRSNPLEW